MNWENIKKILESYTQARHYQLLFDRFNLPKKSSRAKMTEVLHEELTIPRILEPVLSPTIFEDWLTLHQIDGNNYTYVYNLESKPKTELLENLFVEKEKLIKQKIWEFDIQNDNEDTSKVLTNLVDILLVGIHRDEEKGKYIFSFIAPCEVSGSKPDGSSRIFKKMFFAHCVLFDNSNDLKIIFNPTSNLQHVNNVKKDKYDWSPIADMFFEKFQSIIGNHTLKAPRWIPKALHQLAEDATNHNNPKITELAFKAQEKIEDFASDLLKNTGIEVEQDKALLTRLIQDIQYSFEAQLVEKLGTNEDEESFVLFKQRSNGITHTINVESKGASLNGSAAQAARRSRSDSDLELIGVVYRTNGSNYKFLVEQGLDAYLIRGTNTFIEEEVVNIVIRKLNEYRNQIQSAAYSPDQYRKATFVPASK